MKQIPLLFYGQTHQNQSSKFISSSRNVRFSDILNLIFFSFVRPVQCIFLFIEWSKIHLTINNHQQLFQSAICLKCIHMNLPVSFTTITPMSKPGVRAQWILHLSLTELPVCCLYQIAHTT